MAHYTLVKMNKFHQRAITWINLHPEEKKLQQKNPFWIIQLTLSIFKQEKMKLHYLEIHTRVVRLFFFLKKRRDKIQDSDFRGSGGGGGDLEVTYGQLPESW